MAEIAEKKKKPPTNRKPNEQLFARKFFVYLPVTCSRMIDMLRHQFKTAEKVPLMEPNDVDMKILNLTYSKPMMHGVGGHGLLDQKSLTYLAAFFAGGHVRRLRPWVFSAAYTCGYFIWRL